MADTNEQETVDFTPIDAIASEAIRAGISLHKICELLELRVIAVALKRTDGNVAMAARSLGTHRNSLHTKLRKARQ